MRPGEGSPLRGNLRGGELLERERELASLYTLIDEAARGHARLALIEGPAGIGKTRLVAEVRERAAQLGVRVLAAQGAEFERVFPFGVVRQLFEPHVIRQRESLLTGAAADARPVFDPLGEPAGDEAAPADPSFASLHGLYWLTVNLTDAGPLVLAVDDVHWCDRASLRFLAYLTRRLEGLPVLLVCSLRSSEPGQDSALIAEIAGDPAAVQVRPRPFSASAVAELASERLHGEADPAFSAACHVATGGNPLFVSELLKALEAEDGRPDAAHVAMVADLGPRAASRAVLLRLARLPAPAVAVARAVAVLGGGTDLSAVAGLAGIDEVRVADALAMLARAEILQAEPPCGFVHPLVGAAVYQDVPAGERALHHERAARLLTESHATVEKVAAHLLAGPTRGDAWVVATLREAARAALQKGAADSAAAYLARALAEPPPLDRRPEVLLELGRAEALTSGPAATAHLQAAYDTLREPRPRATAAQALARALLFTGFPAESAALARRAAAELPHELDDVRMALEAFELLAVQFGAGDAQALRRLERHRVAPVGPGVGAKMLAAVAAQEWAYACGPSDACAAISLAALDGGDLIEADNGLLGTVAITTLVFADREEALAWWDVARADAHRRGSRFAISSLNLWWGFTQYWHGDLAEAQSALETALGELALWGYGADQAEIYCDAFLSAVLRERGDLPGARRALERSSDPGGGDDGARYWSNSRAELLLAEGRFEAAAAAADDYAGRFGHIVRNPMDAPWRSHKARALDRLGCHDEALDLVLEELELARAWGAPGTVARTLRVLGTLERGAGLDRLEEAVRITAGRDTTRLEHAKSLAALGAALRRRRRPTEARNPLRRALALADVCGARELVRRVRSELYAAGARPRTAALTGVESLTATERRVAELAAEDHINREIAQTLFVTTKTVEMHLSNVYRKLGISSRRKLAGALAAH